MTVSFISHWCCTTYLSLFFCCSFFLSSVCCCFSCCLDFCHLRNDFDDTTWAFCTSKCELIHVTHSIKFVHSFVSAFGSNYAPVWWRNAEEKTATKTDLPLLVLVDELISLFVFIFIRRRIYSWLLLWTQSLCRRFFMSFFAIHCLLICFCVRLICTNGVNSTVIRLGHFSCFHFLSFLIFSFSFHLVFLYSLFAHIRCIFDRLFSVHEFSDRILLTIERQISQYFNSFGVSVHCHFMGKQNWAK